MEKLELGLSLESFDFVDKLNEAIDHINELEKKVEELSQGKSELKEQLDLGNKEQD